MRRFSDSTSTVIVEAILGVTPDMTEKIFNDFPDARIDVFRLLCCVHQYNFCVLFALDSVQSETENEFRYWRSVEMYCEERGFLCTLLKLYHNSAPCSPIIPNSFAPTNVPCPLP